MVNDFYLKKKIPFAFANGILKNLYLIVFYCLFTLKLHCTFLVTLPGLNNIVIL
jgi:hypothetical protein